MTISEIIASNSRPFPSLEIIPPAKGMTGEELLAGMAPLMEFGPKYINVTRHRVEYEFIPNPDGSFSRRESHPRMSQKEVCALVGEKWGVDVVPHIICGGETSEEIRRELADYRQMGVENVLALRGDCILGEKRFVPTEGGYSYANELVSGIREDEKSGSGHLCIGVGAYPEKHFEAPNLETDIANLKRKVDAGADFIITQMFFDNEKFYDFTRLCREAGINVPIIPGLKPLSTLRQLTVLPDAFSIDIPLELSSAVEAAAGNKEEIYRIGELWCIRQCRDLLAHGVPAIHFYTMGRSENVLGILREVF